MINQKNKANVNYNQSTGSSNLNSLTNSKLERDQYYDVAPRANRSNNSPYQQMKGQQRFQQQSQPSGSELPPAPNLNSDRIGQYGFQSNSQAQSTSNKLAGNSYGSQPPNGSNKTQLPQLSKIADRSQNKYQKISNQRSSLKGQKKLGSNNDPLWNASKYSDNAQSSFQNYSAQPELSSSSNQRINVLQMETQHQREVSNIIERCIEMAPKRGSAMNPFVARVDNSANSTGQSSNSNPPPALGLLPSTKNNIVSKAQSSHSLKSDHLKQDNSQFKDNSQFRQAKYGAAISKNREWGTANRMNNDSGSQYLPKYNASSGTVFRDKLNSYEQSQERIHHFENKDKNETDDWENWRQWQKRQSGKDRPQIKSQQDDNTANQNGFKKKISYDVNAEDYKNQNNSTAQTQNKSDKNNKTYSIQSEDDNLKNNQQRAQRRSRLQRMTKNNKKDQPQARQPDVINHHNVQYSSDDDDQNQMADLRMPDPQLEKIQNSLAPFLGGPPTVSSQSWCIYDCNEQCLLKGKLETVRREVASITKMMTFYTVICIMDEYKIDPKKTLIAVSRMGSSVTGTTAELREGDVLSLYQLFYAMMLPSGNDAAYTLGEYFGEFIRTEKYNFQHSDKIFGNIHLSPFYGHPTMKYFLREMNLNAQKLNMFDTFYDSPHGLRNERNFSTAYDVALLTNECMKIPLFRQVVGTGYIETRSLGNQVAMRNFNERKLTHYHWESTNKLLGCLDGLIGCKTGITTAAGPCFAGYYEADGLKLAIILCCSRSMEIRWIEIQRLVAYVKSAVAKYNQMKELQQKQKQRMDQEKTRFTRHRIEGGF